MNVETLRQRYAELTPFERVAMYWRETIGRNREAELDALAARNIHEHYWMIRWNKNFLLVATFGMFQALLAERTAWKCRFRAKDKDARNHFYTAVGWLLALKRLEEESKVPLMDIGKMIDPDYADKLLRQCKKKADIDFSTQYAELRKKWNEQFSDMNEEDQWRKLPPYPTEEVISNIEFDPLRSAID